MLLSHNAYIIQTPIIIGDISLHILTPAILPDKSIAILMLFLNDHS